MGVIRFLIIAFVFAFTSPFSLLAQEEPTCGCKAGFYFGNSWFENVSNTCEYVHMGTCRGSCRYVAYDPELEAEILIKRCVPPTAGQCGCPMPPVGYDLESSDCNIPQQSSCQGACGYRHHIGGTIYNPCLTDGCEQ